MVSQLEMGHPIASANYHKITVIAFSTIHFSFYFLPNFNLRLLTFKLRLHVSHVSDDGISSSGWMIGHFLIPSFGDL